MDVIGILAYGSLIEDPGEAILNLLVRRIHTTTPFPVEFARTSGSRSNAPTLVPFEHGARVKAQILVLQPDITIDQAANILYQRETRQTNRNYKRPLDNEITINTVLVDRLNDFEGVETVLYTRIGSNIQNLTPNNLAESAIQSARANAGANRMDGINYLIAAKRNGIETVLSGDYEYQILELTDADDLETAYEFCRINFSKLNFTHYIPAVMELIKGLDFPWDRIDRLFQEKLRERKLSANGETIIVEATIFDYIIEARKGNSTAVGFLHFLKCLFEEMADNLTKPERQHIQTTITNLLTKHDIGHWGYVAELATLNNLVKSKAYRLKGCEVRLPETKPIDFQLEVVGKKSDVFVEIVSIHLDSDRIDSDPEEMKNFLLKRISDKMTKKGMDAVKYPNLYLIPVLWGTKDAIKVYSDFFKGNSLRIKNVLEPLSYLTLSNGKGYYEHHFKAVTRLFI